MSGLGRKRPVESLITQKMNNLQQKVKIPKMAHQNMKMAVILQQLWEYLKLLILWHFNVLEQIEMPTVNLFYELQGMLSEEMKRWR